METAKYEAYYHCSCCVTCKQHPNNFSTYFNVRVYMIRWFYYFFRDAILFAVANSLTSLLAGFVIFSVLGFMAFKQNVSVADVAESGQFFFFNHFLDKWSFHLAWHNKFLMFIFWLHIWASKLENLSSEVYLTTKAQASLRTPAD